MRPSLGKSGATICIGEREVTKAGGTTDIIKQAFLCKAIGPSVCPEVYNIDFRNQSYTMEKMVPVDNRPVPELVTRAYFLLKENVWCKKVPDIFPTWMHDVNNWLGRFPVNNPSVTFDYESHCTRLQSLFFELYPETPRTHYLIHGDATVANMMKNTTGSLRIIDPVPPRKNVPSLVEVDVAAFIQSLCGWESCGDRCLTVEPVSKEIRTLVFQLAGESKTLYRRSFFWAAYKCLRILRNNYDVESCLWANRWLLTLINETERGVQ